jgi:hypothetical protein
VNEHQETATDSCSSCPMTECRDKVRQSTETGLVGWPFVLSSIGVFMVPLLIGLTSAVVAGGTDTRRFVFGALGLLLGMAISASTYKIFSHISSSKKEIDS